VKIDKIIDGKIIGNHEEGQTRGSEQVTLGAGAKDSNSTNQHGKKRFW